MTVLAPPVIPAALLTENEAFRGREWVLSLVAEWLAGPLPAMVLTGAPGVGKTALAAWLAGAGPEPQEEQASAQLADVRRHWTSVHFCARASTRGSIDPRAFTEDLAASLTKIPGFSEEALRSLAASVTVTQEITGDHVVVTGIRQLTIQGLDTAEVFRTSVVAPLQRLVTRAGGERVLVLVDGLDETPAASGSATILSLVVSLLGIRNVKLLLSTRPDDGVLRQIDDGHGDVTYLDLSSETTRHDGEQDLRRYVQDRLRRMPAADDARVVNPLVKAADGNFAYAEYLLDEVAAGTRDVHDLDGLPHTLYGLYDASVARLMEPRRQAWVREYRPLLGLLVVAPGGSTSTLAAWLGWSTADVTERLSVLGQIVRPATRQHGWSLHHRSVSDYLAAPDVPRFGTRVANPWYVDPAHWHRHIAEYYLALESADWSSVDEYGLANLTHHLVHAILGADDLRARGELLDRLVALIGSPAWRAARRAGLREDHPSTFDLRAAVRVIRQNRPVQVLLDLASRLADDPQPGVRAVAVEILVYAHRSDVKATQGSLRRLLAEGSTTARGAALNAAYRIGAGAREVFLEVARSEDTQLRRTAAIALLLLWRPEPDNITATILDDISRHVSRVPSARNRALLEFMSDLSVAVYITRCEDWQVAVQTAALWRRALKDRLRLGLVNRPMLDRFLTGVVSRAFASRMVETALFTDLQDAPQMFRLSQELARRSGRVLEALDPAVSPARYEDDLASLLDADVPLLRTIAAMVLDVHAHVDLPATAALADRLVDRLSPAGSVWVLLGFTTRLPTAAEGWLPVVEGLTRRLVTAHPEVLLSRGIGTLSELDIVLLPLGEAYAQAGRHLTAMDEMLQEAAANGDTRRRVRIVEALAPVGFRHPLHVLRTLEPLLADEAAVAELEEGLVTCLASMAVGHPQVVDEALMTAPAAGLRERVLDLADVASVWRYVWWLGLYKNAVHQALHYPLMREKLLQGGLRVLITSSSPQEVLQTIAPALLRMVREADYNLLAWTRP